VKESHILQGRKYRKILDYERSDRNSEIVSISVLLKLCCNLTSGIQNFKLITSCDYVIVKFHPVFSSVRSSTW